MGVSATDGVTNANPPPRNSDTVSSKEVDDFKEAMGLNDSSKQSQGTSNSNPIILASRPPINLAAFQKANGLQVDGKLGPKTEQAIKAFQKANGLQVDGIVGPETKAALTRAAAH